MKKNLRGSRSRKSCFKPGHSSRLKSNHFPFPPLPKRNGSTLAPFQKRRPLVRRCSLDRARLQSWWQTRAERKLLAFEQPRQTDDGSAEFGHRNRV